MTQDRNSRAVRRDYLREHLREVPPFRALVRSVECRLFERAGAPVEPTLDVGCGDGHFASLAFGAPLSVGIELDAALLSEAQARGAHTHLVAASATAMPFSDSFFNTVVANCVVEHIPDIEATLREISRVLCPGGRFLFGVPSQHFGDMLLVPTLLRACGMRRLARGYGDWFNNHSRHFHTDSPEVWLARLGAFGFRVERWEYYLTHAAHRAFDLAHYLSLPHLVSRKLTGKWVTAPVALACPAFERWLRPFYEADAPRIGPYIFFQTRKV
jgi:SAM-dependent methyltransferase